MVDFAGTCHIQTTFRGRIADNEPGDVSGACRISFTLRGRLTATPPALPCVPDVEVLDIRPVMQSDADGPLMAERILRLTIREVSIRYDLLNAAERAAVDRVWAGGDGLFRKFEFTVPGEIAAELFVFRDDRWTLARENAANATAEIVLLKVR